jgi:hypothetical protein
MTYIDELTSQIIEVFDKAKDKTDLQEKVLAFVQSKVKESFKNGLETARNKQPKYKGQKAKQS